MVRKRWFWAGLTLPLLLARPAHATPFTPLPFEVPVLGGPSIFITEAIVIDGSSAGVPSRTTITAQGSPGFILELDALFDVSGTIQIPLDWSAGPGDLAVTPSVVDGSAEFASVLDLDSDGEVTAVLEDFALFGVIIRSSSAGWLFLNPQVVVPSPSAFSLLVCCLVAFGAPSRRAQTRTR